MQCVKKYREKLTKLGELKQKYSLDTSDINAMLKEMDCFRVTSPIIGNFSTGKSSLLNAILGERLLSVDITPETAVPTELYYGNNEVFICKGDTKRREVISKLPFKDLTIEEADVVCVEYNNEFLREVNNVKLVDLPGFDTGIELHNKAIDQYMPNSLAYILVVAVDEPVLKDDIADVIKELDLQKIPLYIVLSKCARISEEDVEACKKLITEIVKKITGDYEVNITTAESYGDVNVEGVKDFIRQIQKDATELFENNYKGKISNSFLELKTYLSAQIAKKGMSFSQVELERERINIEVKNLMDKVEKEQIEFDKQTEECIQMIKRRTKTELENSIPEISSMLQNGQDVNERINKIIRNVVAVEIKTEYEPRLQKYLKTISEMIKIDVNNDESIKIDLTELMSNNFVYDISKKVVPFALAAIGAVISGGGIGLVIGGIVGAFIDSAINISQSNIREKKAEKVAKDITELVSDEVSNAVSNQIKSYLQQINNDLEREMLRQKNLLDKAIKDIEVRLELENDAKNYQIAQIEKDLFILKDIMRDL